MGKPKKSDYVPDASLSQWFKLQKYAALANASPEKWAQLILDRASLRLLLKHPEDNAVLRALFENLKVDPLCELGFTYRWKSGHELDPLSVKSLTINRLRQLLDEAEGRDDSSRDGINASSADLTGKIATAPNLPSSGADSCDRRNPTAAIDELLLTSASIFSGTFAHLAVDLRATDKQLTSDFKKWLGQWRKHAGSKVTGGYYTTKILRWHQTRLLPYFDLRLFADIEGKRISREKFVELLDFKERPSPKDLLDQLSKQADQNISFDTFHALHGLSE